MCWLVGGVALTVPTTGHGEDCEDSGDIDTLLHSQFTQKHFAPTAVPDFKTLGNLVWMSIMMTREPFTNWGMTHLQGFRVQLTWY